MADNNLNVEPIQHLLIPTNKSKSVSLSKMTSLNKKYPKIVGDIRHYPPANKEWKNSVYAYNKNNLRSLTSLDKMATKTIKSYFSLTNNKKLARSERMRNLIRRRSVKRLFVSKPEIKQTSDKVNITVYTLNRERQFFLRKMYFYNRNMYISKNVYLYKLWLKKNLLAFKKTFYNRKSIIPFVSLKKIRKMKNLMTKRRKKNKTYLHNILLKRYFLSRARNFKPQPEKSKNLKFTLNNRGQKKSQVIINIARNNLLKSMAIAIKKRRLMRFLKKREEKKINLAIPLTTLSTKSKLKSKDLVSNIREQKVKKTFKNYFVQKISKKVNYKLRNFNSILKIVKKMRRLKRFRFSKIRLPYSNLKFKNEIRFFSFKLISELKYIRKLFKFYFIKYLFHTLGITIGSEKVDSASAVATIKNKNEISSFYIADKKYLINVYDLKNNLVKGSDQIDEIANYLNVNKSIVKKYIKTGKLIKGEYYIKASKKNLKIIKFKNKYSYDKLKNIELLNLELLHFLKRVLLGSSSFLLERAKNNSLYTVLFTKNNKENLDYLYKNFEKKYFLNFLAKLFKKEYLYINYYSKFLINQLKFGKFLPGLKILISKIYSKKVELNLVNLKYPQLNSDIYTEAIATKLKRKVGLLRVLKWSLNLAKLPYEYLPHNRTSNVNKLQPLTIHKSLDLNILTEGSKKNKVILPKSSEDKLDGVLNKLYPSSFVHHYSPFSKKITGHTQGSDLNRKNQKLDEKSSLMKSLSVLNIIKYKWVSGVRLEAAGRLTRRYTAARSVFKFRYKGNLKNIDYSLKLDPTKKNISTVMLRNQVKSNSQYSFNKSKRRIGAFGIKAWIGSY